MVLAMMVRAGTPSVASWRTMRWLAKALIAASVSTLGCSSGGSAGPNAGTTSPPTSALGEAVYRLHAGGGWSLNEAYNATPEGTATAGLEPSLDWYAEYEAPPLASPRRIRLSGHGGTVENVAGAMKGFGFESARVGASDGLVGDSPDAAGPSVVVFAARPDYCLMALSYELSSDELIAWSEDLVPVSESEWIKAGGRVDR